MLPGLIARVSAGPEMPLPGLKEMRRPDRNHRQQHGGGHAQLHPQRQFPGDGGLLADADGILADEGGQEFSDRLRALAVVGRQRPVDCLEEGLAVFCPLPDIDRRLLRVALDARGSLNGLPAGDEPVEHAAHRVEVRPGALATVRMVLLEGRVARRDDAGHAVGRAGGRSLARRTEVEQHQAAVRIAYVDVGGLDVAVQEAGFVHLVQALQERHEHLHQVRLVGRVLAALQAFFQPRVQALAELVVHHHVGGVVVLEKAVDADDVGVAEGRQGARFEQEAVQPDPVLFLVAAALGPDGGGLFVAHRQVVGQVFLDRHLGVQVGIVRQVGDAEAADAQHALDAVLVQHVANRQRQPVIVAPGGLGAPLQFGIGRPLVIGFENAAMLGCVGVLTGLLFRVAGNGRVRRRGRGPKLVQLRLQLLEGEARLGDFAFAATGKLDGLASAEMREPPVSSAAGSGAGPGAGAARSTTTFFLRVSS